jgi:putative transposase
MRFTFISTHLRQWPVPILCRTLEVSESGFWAWRSRPACARARRDAALCPRIMQSHTASDGTYGVPRVHADLVESDPSVGTRTVARLMGELGIAGISGRKRVRTTISDPSHPVAENVLNRDFTAQKPNQRWVTDITVIATEEGPLSLSAIEDLYSRKVVGWAMDTHMETSLVLRALDAAIASRRPEAGLLHHSDRGCQYTSQAYRQHLEDHHFDVSMSRRGNCHDNACAESFWGRMKVECIYRTHFATRVAAQQAVFRYIEVFYNRTRRHSALGYLSPDAFEALHAAA